MSEPRDAIPKIVKLLRAVLGDRLRSVLLVGSVAKDDWIPFWSDLDIHVFVEGRRTSGLPPRDIFGIHDALKEITPSDYAIATLQVRTFNAAGYPAGFAPPWPGTFELVWGAPLVTPDLEELARAYGQKADDTLIRLDRALAKIGETWMCAPDEDLPNLVTRLGAVLKDAMFAVGIQVVGPGHALKVRRDELATLVGDAVSDNAAARRFLTSAGQWLRVTREPATLRVMFEDCHRALTAISAWAAARFQLALLGQRVVSLRRRRGWSQRKLADAAGVSPDSVGLIESRDYPLPRAPRYPPAIELVAKALEVPLVDLLTLRTDAEIAASAFADLLGAVQRRRVESEEGPRAEQ